MNQELVLRLATIQQKLKAPKSQFNKFGGYYYRNCEDIMEAVKPLLLGKVLLVSDEIVQVGERYYVKATATLTDGVDKIEVSAYARESLDKKGMDEAQITGAASSYARKYALNGLFAIDDTKDADSQDNTKNSPKTVIKTSPVQKSEPEVEEKGLDRSEGPTMCPKHPKQAMKNHTDDLGNRAFGHLWTKDTGEVLICTGKGFTSFNPKS